MVKNNAVAINPIDWTVPYVGTWMFPWLRYPPILGSDLSEMVAAVGSDVVKLKGITAASTYDRWSGMTVVNCGEPIV